MPHATDRRTPDIVSPRVQPALSTTDLTKRYADVLAVDELTFSLQPGSITGFLGPNGAGKRMPSPSQHDPEPTGRTGPPVWLVAAIVLAVLVMVALQLTGVVGPG